jgi:type IV secretion system protein TrbL
MANDVAVIDRFLDIFSRYIDSGFGLISGDVGFLVRILIGIDVVVAALAWAAGEDEVIQAFAKKILYVGFFAFILNSWNALAQVIFNSFAALGLKATGSSLSYADFLRPGKLAQAGVQGADVLLAQIQRLSGFPEVFWNLSEIMLMALSWVVTLVAFFVLAIMLFLAVIEFKLTTLKGFILVPFALWRGISFIAEPVLGQIVTSGVRILVFAVVTGIGTQIFSQILPSNPAAELSLQDALTVLLASMTVGGLALYAPKIAAGIVSGAPPTRAGCCRGAGRPGWRHARAGWCWTRSSGSSRCRRGRLRRNSWRRCTYRLCIGKRCCGQRGSGRGRRRPRRCCSRGCLGGDGWVARDRRPGRRQCGRTFPHRRARRLDCDRRISDRRRRRGHRSR